MSIPDFRFLTAGLFLLLLPCLASGQQAILSGTVHSATGQPVEGAYVILGNNRYHDITDERGRFSIAEISPGPYTVTVSRVGYHTVQKKVSLAEGDSLRKTYTMTPARYRTGTVTVTATRTPRDVEEVPVPVTVVGSEEIDRSGSIRLDEILAQQTGLTLTSDHGTGIQVQGFDSEYTLIMVDGQPLIGRTAGTLDLSRVSIGNVKQVEMTKGPSSALWGSDAMAGVINIITEEGDRPFELGVNSRYGSNSTLDIGANVSWNTEGWRNTLFINRNSSEGYRLVPGSISRTVPDYENYTASYGTEISVTESIDLELDGRYYRETQQNTDYLGSQSDPTLLDQDAVQEDYSLSPVLKIRPGSAVSLELGHYTSGYETRQSWNYRRDGSLYDEEVFDQHYNKSEAQANLFWDASHTTTAGAGVNWEHLVSARYEGNPRFRNLFLYGQHQWQPGEQWDVIAGFRYDAHSEYTNQLSPKFSVRYALTEQVALRGSVGRGFKAPAFRQLFLNFTNPTVGYSVFGSSTVAEKIRRLQEEGKIERILRPMDQLDEIRAERSWAYNAGVDFHPMENIQVRVNAYWNDVNDLIESAPVAEKTNGQSAFSYFNLRNIYTRGVETELRWNRVQGLELSAGYQLLDARRKVNETRTVQDEQGNPVERTFTSWKPLFNRSRHSANLKVFYHYEPWDVEANLRGRWHSRYGRLDSNGNGYVDPGEYEESYSVWDAALAKQFADRYSLQFGVDNLFGFTRPGDMPYLSGRVFYAKASLQLY